jgi:hypothetical protein
MSDIERDTTDLGRPLAPLVRLGGRWWYRDEIFAGAADVDVPSAIGDLDPPIHPPD